MWYKLSVRITRSSILLTLSASIVLIMLMPAASQQVQAMNPNTSSSDREAGEPSSQGGSSQSGSGTVQPNATGSAASDLSNYPDNTITAMPTQPVSMHYVVEHRSELNGKTITVRGIVARTLWPSTGNTSTGEQSMANPQPRIFLADNLRKGRDKNFDLMILLREGERGYSVGQKARIKVRVDSNKIAVVMHKVS